MNTTYTQYCKYLKHLLEVECAERDLDFEALFTSYINPKQNDDEERKRREAERIRLAQIAEQKRHVEEDRWEKEIRRKEEAVQKELEEKKCKDAELQKDGIEQEIADQEGRPEEEQKIKELELQASKHRGDLEFEDGYYVGETKDGLMHGRGTRYWDYDDKKWVGEWAEGEACGHVVVSFGDFVVYDGNMEHGLPNGQGIYTDMNNGQRYEGSFVDFKREGEGVLYTEEGDKIYDGEWKNGKYHGYGQYFLRGQCRYEGNWENGKRNGEGIAYDQNGVEEYNGLWKEDSRLNDIDRIKVASQQND